MRDVKDPEIRRAEIMDAAMLLFMEKGYANTTTQDIVDKVNISRGLLYYHFKNKEDILYCLVERYSEKLLRDIHVIVNDDDKTAIEKIRAFIDATIISTDNVSAEGTELQKTVDLEENRYMLDKLSHKLIEKLTIYFERIINQGISEKVFSVKYPYKVQQRYRIPVEYSCAATPQIRQTGNRLSGLAETVYASLLAQCFV